MSSLAPPHSIPPDSRHDPRVAWIDRAVEHARHLLPAQAPLEVFVHHNTLHMFQHLPFHEALDAAREKLGGRGYLTIDAYRAHHARGRIRGRDLEAVFAKRPPPPLGPIRGMPDTDELARLVMVHSIRPTTPADIAFRVSELSCTTHFEDGVSEASKQRILTAEGPRSGRSDTTARAVAALYGAASERCAGHVRPIVPFAHRIRFLRDMLLRVIDEDACELVNPVLIPLAGAFLDRGQSRWSMPDRHHGMYEAWSRFETAGKAVRASWLASLGERLRTSRALGLGSHGVVLRAVDELGITEDEFDEFIEHELVMLPGWAGMFNRLEHAPGPIGRSRARVRLVDFLAVRLTLDTLALADVAQRHGYTRPLADLRAELRPLIHERGPRSSEAEYGFPLFRLCQHAGVDAATLRAIDDGDFRRLLDWLSAFGERERLVRWHEAYERNYADALLTGIARSVRDRREVERPLLQTITCIDDRCESLRRHVEERSLRFETFGAPGFFNLAIAYKGLDDPSSFPLCPVVVTPRHRVVERVKEEHRERAAKRTAWLRRWGKLDAAFHRASSSFVWAPVVTTVTGFAAALPLLGSVFAPRMTAGVQERAKRSLVPDLETTITSESESESGDDDELYDGFDLDEQETRVGALLENLGLVRSFAPIVAIIGHDSASANNPHVAAYSCGACGGRSGGPNARLFARMANRPDVRARLRGRGIAVPDDTWFVGGVHNTASEQFRFFDLDSVPGARRDDLTRLFDVLDQARLDNAHERCRRFFSAPRDPTPHEALRHVEERTVSLGQARPELGHVTNASCIVGRRSLSRGLFLDRRAFLVSYDPSIDPDGAVLERILLAAGPVCAGINLEYFFSTVDNERWGAGTKLPHNVTGLFGVMNGASSDLRTGLPKQMIEIHEPIRLVTVVESAPEVLSAIVDRQPSLADLVRNEWIRIACVDPVSGTVHTYDALRGFEPFDADATELPIVERSVDHYGIERDFVAPALVRAHRPGHFEEPS